MRTNLCAVRTCCFVFPANFASDMSCSVYFIIATALATVVTLIVIGLAMFLVYYHWRNTELMKGISAFIRRNWKMEQQINQLQKEFNQHSTHNSKQ